MSPVEKKRILNVNDAAGARYMVTRMLERAGFEVFEADSGLSALEKTEQTDPHLIVLDVRLPDIDGLEVCRRLRANPKTSAIKVLHTSATFVTSDKKVESLEGGADGYLGQPFEHEELIATVRSLLRLGEAEDALRTTAEQLRLADRRKDEFLAMLAHELRNPLAAITACFPIMTQHDPANSAEARAREVVRRQTTHLARLIDDLLDVARVTTGKIELHPEPVDLSALIARVVASMRETRTDVRRQTLGMALPNRPVIVNGDALRLEQVVTNLLDNASKYTDPGGHIQIALDILHNGKSGRVRLLVRDTGIGISRDALPTIFGLFAQSNVSIARSRGGLGIGLTLVRSLVEMHGGTIEARSRGLGEGSEFEVELPALGDTSVAVPVKREPSESKVSRRILIVEDNIDAQESLAALCEMWGHSVSVASDGLSGVTAILEQRPQIALVDIGLPGIDGFEVARRVRAQVGRDVTVLVALTGYGDVRQKAAAAEAGFDMHVVKPIDPDRLEVLLQKIGRDQSTEAPGVDQQAMTEMSEA